MLFFSRTSSSLRFRDQSKRRQNDVNCAPDIEKNCPETKIAFIKKILGIEFISVRYKYTGVFNRNKLVFGKRF